MNSDLSERTLLHEMRSLCWAVNFYNKTKTYVQVVESRREGTAMHQQVIATLGRVEDLRASRQLERMLCMRPIGTVFRITADG